MSEWLLSRLARRLRRTPRTEFDPMGLDRLHVLVDEAAEMVRFLEAELPTDLYSDLAHIRRELEAARLLLRRLRIPRL